MVWVVVVAGVGVGVVVRVRVGSGLGLWSDPLGCVGKLRHTVPLAKKEKN